MPDDETYMKRAIRLARRGAGCVEPNPMVGCVIVKAGKIVGEGWHKKFGGPHAEVNALAAAGSRARGATAYVTLEPCKHEGKTPPCADALIEAKVKRVLIGARDPNATSGGGIRRLRRARIDVAAGVCADEAAELIAPFAKVVTRGLPYVICKWAQTVDGKIATRTGDSQWISSPGSRRIVHQMRARVDAVMVGIGTALADDPLLTARDVKLRRTARRAVVDPSLKLPVRSKLIGSIDAAPVTVVCTKAAARGPKAKQLRGRGVEVLSVVSKRRNRLDLHAAMRWLVSEHGATNVLVEGGAGLHGSLLEQGLADEWVVFTGPRVLGDAEGLSAIDSGRGVRRMADAAAAELVECRKVGPDAMLRYRLCGS